MDNLYDDANYVGIFYTKTIFYISIVVFVVCLCLSIHFFTKNTDNIIYTTGEVNEAKCSSYSSGYGDNISIRNKCKINVSYEANKKKYNKDIIVDKSAPVFDGENISLEYDIDNPNNIHEAKITNKSFGKIILIGGSFFLIISGVRYYFAKKYKLVSSVAGIKGLYNLF